MKKFAMVAMALFIAFSVSFTVFAGDKKEMSPEEKAWVEFMTPGWAHELLAKQTGKWKTETKFWHAPGTPPEVSPGELESKMVLGGRYLESKFTGLAMGQPFEGMSIEGYGLFNIYNNTDVHNEVASDLIKNVLIILRSAPFRILVR